MARRVTSDTYFRAIASQDLETLATVPANIINETDAIRSKTPLVYACEYGSVDVVKCLLSNPNIDPNQACTVKPYTTPMMAAIRKKNLEIIKLLLPLVSINDSLVDMALEYGFDLRELKNQVCPKLLLKKYQRDTHNGIKYFKPALNQLRPGLASLITNQQFISKLSTLELVTLQGIIDVLMYENKQSLAFDIFEVMRMLFLLDTVSGEFTKLKERAITIFQDQLTMKNVLDILDDITKYLERTKSNNSIFLSLREYCLDFIAVNSRSPIHIPLYEKHVETDERLDKYFRTLFKRNTIRPVSLNEPSPSFNNFSLGSLFGEKINCDVILSIDGKDVPCHKTILSSKSLFFETMFNGDWNSKEQYGPEMLYIVKECYNIRDQIPKEHLLPTMTEAHKHDMKDLVQFCAAKIEIDEDNFFEMVNELEQHFDDPLFEDVAEKILDFGASNANSMFKWSNVRHLPNSVMFMITIRLNCGKPKPKPKINRVEDNLTGFNFGSPKIQNKPEVSVTTPKPKNSGFNFGATTEPVRKMIQDALPSSDATIIELIDFQFSEGISSKQLRNKFASQQRNLCKYLHNRENFLNIELKTWKSKSARDVRLIPVEFFTSRRIILEAVKLNGQLYIDHSRGSFPSWRFDKELLKNALSISGALIFYGDPSIAQDEDVIESAIQYKGFTIQSLPEKYLEDKEFILRVLKVNPFNIYFLGNYLENDEDIILEAAKGNINHISETELLNKRMARLLVNLDGLNLNIFPKFQNDLEIIQIAVSQNGLALMHCSTDVPYSIVKIAVKQNGLALEFAEEKLRDESEIVLLAVKQNGLALRFASNRLRSDKNIVKQALSQNPLAIEHAINVCWEIKFFQEQLLSQMTEELILKTIGETTYIKHLPNKLLNEIEFVEKALLENPDIYEFLPYHLKTDKNLIIKTISEDIPIEILPSMLEDEEFLLDCFKHSKEFTRQHELTDGQLSDREFIKKIIVANPDSIRTNKGIRNWYIHDESMVLFTLKQRNGMAVEFLRFIDRKELAIELARHVGFFCELTQTLIPYEEALKERLSFEYDNVYLTRNNLEDC